MSRLRWIVLASWIGAVVTLSLGQIASGQLRIVDYNVAGLSNSSALTTVLQTIGMAPINGVAKPIDVMILQETDINSGDTQAIVNILNGIYGAGTYARGTINGTTTGAGRPTLVYNTQTVFLYPVTGDPATTGEAQVGTTSSSGAARAPMRYRLRPVGYDSSADFYIYNSHYKSSDSGTDAARRNVEATTIRTHATLGSDALGLDAHVIYAGDFNIYRSSEPMWGTLMAAGNGKAVDPLGPGAAGNWHDGSSFKGVHTQNPAGNGFVGGGMDDRFDFQLVTEEFMDGEGLDYLSGSYHAFGNNGSHNLNGHINTGNGWGPDPSQTPWDDATVLNALGQVSDHLPVVAQYQVPAKMGTSVASVPAQVIVGVPLMAQVSVRNTAGDGPNPLVVSSIGADELDYRLQGSGAAMGTQFGSAMALENANLHEIALDTSLAGSRSALLEIDAIRSPVDLTNPQVPNGHQELNVNYSVLDHASASFSSESSQHEITIDFGSIQAGSGDQHMAFSIYNLVATPGFTAALDLLWVDEVGDSGILNVDLAPFDDLAAGGGNDFLATLDASFAGDYSATYEIILSDDTSLLGASMQSLTLNLVAQVTSGLTGDLNDDGFVDGDDIDILWHIVRNGGADPNDDDSEDLNGDSFVNEDDVDYMLANLLDAGTSRSYGDADLDGGVGGLDFTAWRLRAGTGWANGDFDGDGGIGGLDFTLWRTRPSIYPENTGPHGGTVLAVPEPATWMAMGLGMSVILIVGSRRVRSSIVLEQRVLVIILVLASGTAAAEDLYIAFWNVENLFDTIDDPAVVGDEEFTSEGAKNWTEERLKRKLDNLSRVICKMNDGQGPDILGLCEVENRSVVKKLIDHLDIRNRDYQIVHKDSPSDRGIDCALIYDATVVSLADARFHFVDAERTRDIVEAKLQCGDQMLYVFVNHWPSRLNPEAQRFIAADTLWQRLKELQEGDQQTDIVVIGDFNDTPSDPSIRNRLQTANSRESVEPHMFNTSADLKEGTYVFDNRWEMLDQVIVSPGMLDGTRFTWVPASTQILKFDFQMFQPSFAGAIARPSRSYSRNDFHVDGFSDHLPVNCVVRRSASDSISDASKAHR